jgi:uncharacterized cupredoxin-like copper-binding protein
MVRSHKLTGVAAAAILLPAALAAAGCGSSSTSTTTTGSPASTGSSATVAPTTSASTSTTPGQSTGSTAPVAQTVDVTTDPSGQLAFTQKTLKAKAGTIKFVLRNDSSLRHNLTIQGNGVTVGPSATISGGTTDLVATLKPGTYEFYCAIPGHKDAGMHGTLTVT